MSLVQPCSSEIGLNLSAPTTIHALELLCLEQIRCLMQYDGWSRPLRRLLSIGLFINVPSFPGLLVDYVESTLCHGLNNHLSQLTLPPTEYKKRDNRYVIKSLLMKTHATLWLSNVWFMYEALQLLGVSCVAAAGRSAIRCAFL